VDEKSAYWRPRPEDEEPLRLYAALRQLLRGEGAGRP
jgi:hypothetical protein